MGGQRYIRRAGRPVADQPRSGGRLRGLGFRIMPEPYLLAMAALRASTPHRGSDSSPTVAAGLKMISAPFIANACACARTAHKWALSMGHVWAQVRSEVRDWERRAACQLTCIGLWPAGLYRSDRSMYPSEHQLTAFSEFNISLQVPSERC